MVASHLSGGGEGEQGWGRGVQVPRAVDDKALLHAYAGRLRCGHDRVESGQPGWAAA